MAAAEAVATSADEEVVCEGEKTREERDAELRGEAVSLDDFGGMRGVALAARRVESWRASVKRAGKSWGARTVKVLGYICS